MRWKIHGKEKSKEEKNNKKENDKEKIQKEKRMQLLLSCLFLFSNLSITFIFILFFN